MKENLLAELLAEFLGVLLIEVNLANRTFDWAGGLVKWSVELGVEIVVDDLFDWTVDDLFDWTVDDLFDSTVDDLFDSRSAKGETERSLLGATISLLGATVSLLGASIYNLKPFKIKIFNLIY